MLDVALHVGIEHPNLLWLLVTAVISFGAGIAVGRYGRATASDTAAETTNNSATDTASENE